MAARGWTRVGPAGYVRSACFEAERAGQITALAIDSAGLVYEVTGNGFGPNRLVFVPFARLEAAVS